MATTNIDLGANNSATITFHTKDKYNTEDMVFDIKRKDLGLWECTTAAATTAKVITTPAYAATHDPKDAYTPKEGDSIKVYFTYLCGAANATLNIDETGAYPIKIRTPTNVDSNDQNWRSGSIIELTFYQNAWYLNDVNGWRAVWNSKSSDGLVYAPSKTSVASKASLPSVASANAFWTTDANGDTNWRSGPLNNKTVAGIVPAPTSTHPNSVWKTNASGVPSWQLEAEANGWCETPLRVKATSSNQHPTITFAQIDAAAEAAGAPSGYGYKAWNELFIVVLFGGAVLSGVNVDYQTLQVTKNILTSEYLYTTDGSEAEKHFNMLYPVNLNKNHIQLGSIRVYSDGSSIWLNTCKVINYELSGVFTSNENMNSRTEEFDYLTGIHTGACYNSSKQPMFMANGACYVNGVSAASTSANYKRVNEGFYFIKDLALAASVANDSVKGATMYPYSDTSTTNMNSDKSLAELIVYYR